MRRALLVGDLSFAAAKRWERRRHREKRGERRAWAEGRDRVSDRAVRGRARGKTRGSDESIVLRAFATLASGSARRSASIAASERAGKPAGTRARFGTAAARAFKMARGSTDPPLEALGSGHREVARGATRTRIDRARGGSSHRTRRARDRTPPASFRSRTTRRSFLDPIATCLVPPIGFRGDARGRRAHAPSLPSAGVRSRGACRDSEDATNASSFRVGHARTGAAAVAIDGGWRALWRAVKHTFCAHFASFLDCQSVPFDTEFPPSRRFPAHGGS